MNRNRKITTGVLVVVMAITSLLVIKAQKQSKPDDEIDVTAFPTVDYESRKNSRTENQRRKSKKYNSGAPVITEDKVSIFHVSDWDLRLPALPAKLSAAVIIGEVTAAEAHFSADQTDVYSEFDVQISEVLKNDDNAPLTAGSHVVLERAGGRVRFSSGKVMVSATNHQNLPRIGKRYLFFLTHHAPNAHVYEDFLILTAYELRDGQVFPLDKADPGYPRTAYKGASESVLRNDLAVILAETP